MIVGIPAAERIERWFEDHHFSQRNDRHQVIALRRRQRILQLLQLGHRAVHAKLAAIDLNDRHHARLVEIDPQTLRPFAERRRMLFRLNKVHHQLFTQAAVLGKQVHQARLLQHHLCRHTDQLTVFSQ